MLNAGTVSTRKIVTVDGHESVYATNALSGGFLLALSMLPFMPDNARIVFNTSVAAFDVPPLSASAVDSSDLLGQLKIGDELKLSHMLVIYARSKALQLLIAQELARRLQQAGRKIAIQAVHPGIIMTAMWTGKPVHRLHSRRSLTWQHYIPDDVC